MTDKETPLIGCPLCGDIYRWQAGGIFGDSSNWECLGKLSKEEMVARALQVRAGKYGWLCMDCQKKRSGAPLSEETSL